MKKPASAVGHFSDPPWSVSIVSLSSYDPIAEMYHSLWADWYLPAAMPALERLFFANVPATAKVMDVCCGSGHVTQELIRRGYQVTAVDASAGLIEIARRDWPNVDWRVQDVRRLDVEQGQYAAALSTFDSLNHVGNADDLYAAFVGVHRALEPGGIFVFDMNLQEAFLTDVNRWTVEVADTKVSLIRGTFDPGTKIARTELVWFVQEESSPLWRQQRSVVEQRSFTQQEILLALGKAGFHDMEALSAEEAGMAAELGFGRLFVTARA